LTHTDATLTSVTVPKVQQNVVSPKSPVEGRVISTELCTAGGKKAAGFVRHVAIDVTGTPLAGSFKAGQSFGVVPPGHDEQGKPHKLRLYSLACPSAGEDGEGNVVATTVKRLIDEHWKEQKLFAGIASNYLCDLRVGDTVTLTGPAGKRFLLPEDPGAFDYIFFATGTGIAPFRGMLGDLAASGVRSRVALVMGAPFATDLLYDDELRALEAEHDWFRYLPALSRVNQHDGFGPMYVHQRIEQDPEAQSERGLRAMLDSDRTVVYVCGIAGMELGVFKTLAKVLPPDRLAQYAAIDPEIAHDPGSWDRKMIGRAIKPTDRVMLEVY